MNQAQDIEEVVSQLQLLAEQCQNRQSRAGYFGALYQDVTKRVAMGIFEGDFSSPNLVENLDVTFANRYLRSYFAYQKGKPTEPLWNDVFAFNAQSWPTIIQHLLASCAVHIGFDLGYCVAQTVPKNSLAAFRSDFDTVNNLLASAFDDLNADLKDIWPLYRFATFGLSSVEDDVVDLVMSVERDNAWNFALALAHSPSETDRDKLISKRLQAVSQLMRLITHPGFVGKGISRLLSRTEGKPVSKNISIMLDNPNSKMPPEPAPHSGKRKVAILGGGIGALAAAVKLTSDPDWREHLDITVYQMGWRLGGKGATGRNPEYGNRIEEHGLHMWFGFYDAAFSTMREVFNDLKRPESHPIRSVETAFLPIDTYTFAQVFRDNPELWHIYWPPNDRIPGDKNSLEISDYLVSAVRLFERLVLGEGGHNETFDAARAAPRTLTDSIVDWLESRIEGGNIDVRISDLECKAFVALVRGALRLLKFALGSRVQTDLTAYRIWIGADTIGAILIGFVEDRIFERGFDSINDQNWNAWLRAKGIDETTYQSCMVQVGYDSSFGYHQGVANMEAGTTLSGALQMFFGYKGSIVYKFLAGTGDTIFEPLAACLKKRGVNFSYFHKVEEIISENGVVSEITMQKQATLKNGTYQPYVKVKGIDCWPQEPLYDQLVEGAQLKAEGINLESHWTPWKGVETLHLKQGVDFDDVICGISIQGLHGMTDTLSDQNPKWKDMLEHIKTTPTMAYQLWLKPTLDECGWWQPDNAILSCNGEPLDSYADLSCVIPYEDPQNGVEPGSAAYFCGAMFDQPEEVPPPSDHGYPQKALDRVKWYALDYIRTKLQPSWPNTFKNDQFDWDLLVGPATQGLDEKAFDTQFWKANVDPSERYVLSVVGSTKYRLKSDESGFQNFYLAGDWTDNGVVNAGCMEAGALSGIQAAQGLMKRVAASEGALPLVSEGSHNPPRATEVGRAS